MLLIHQTHQLWGTKCSRQDYKMAGLDPSIISNLKTPTPMSLGDIMGLATNAQAYKQAQQINPIALKTAQSESEKSRTEADVSAGTAPSRISGAKSTASKLEIEAKKAGIDFNQHVSNAGAGLFGGFVTDPDFVQGNGPAMIKKIKGAQSYARDVLGLPDNVIQNSDHLIELAETDPQQAYQKIKNGVLQSGANAAQTNLVTPRPETIGGVGYSYTPAGNVAMPLGQGGNQPPAATTQQTVNNTVQAEDLTKPTYSQREPLKYPQRDLSKPFTPIQGEEVERTTNQNYRLGLVDKQSTLVPYKRNLEEVISSAGQLGINEWHKGAGFLGKAGKNISTFLGTEQGQKYQELSKDLANVQIAALKANGGSMDTVAGQALQRTANGEDTYMPDVLIKIARRSYGDVINTDMQATGASKAAEKYGDNNLGKYRKEWAKNADSRVFELMSLPQLIKDPVQRKKMADEIIGFPVGSKQREVFLNKYRNIQKLSQDGAL